MLLRCVGHKVADPHRKKIGTYLNLPDVRKVLGVDKGTHKWESCDNAVGEGFHLNLDQVGQTWLYVSQLLERGVRILNYAGELDDGIALPTQLTAALNACTGSSR
jgi:cathepsin A (carboxypeptidase C)